LQAPLSEIANAVLCEPFMDDRSRSLWDQKPDAFSPAHLKFPVLNKIGSLKIDWTEYMEEHLRFDVTTMTVSVFWFFSHISDNASWQ
jgi:hypothetical protein